jgi:hypothetical protein
MWSQQRVEDNLQEHFSNSCNAIEDHKTQKTLSPRTKPQLISCALKDAGLLLKTTHNLTCSLGGKKREDPSLHDATSHWLDGNSIPNSSVIRKVRKTQHQNPEFGHTQGEIFAKPAKNTHENHQFWW